MDKLLKLAEQAGMSEEQGKTAAGGIFGFLKKQLKEEDYAKLTSQFPEADALATQQTASSSADSGSGGLLGAAMGALGGGSSSGGSGGRGADLTTLLAQLAGKGVTPQQIQKFLPMAAPHIKKLTGIDVSSMLGTPAAGENAPASNSSTNATEGGETTNSLNPMDMLNSLTGSGSGGGNSNPLSSAMGMFGK
ncbi:DUF2780 VcgC/VcgE domain containing protein [Nitzschia inconspicua]|uniref:DUF2780 VcgC/VcgE domain containing protein n=1 Tax=Nitzschia inconspicua TaxID=303405 RepID=A0A9K3PXC0_9STRA|nr:DUF2780 VcgC/VcgE domain containing protein [Nitzschia inconspicua]